MPLRVALGGCQRGSPWGLSWDGGGLGRLSPGVSPGFPQGLSMGRVLGACPGGMSLGLVLGACPWGLSLRHVLRACPQGLPLGVAPSPLGSFPEPLGHRVLVGAWRGNIIRKQVVLWCADLVGRPEQNAPLAFRLREALTLPSSLVSRASLESTTMQERSDNIILRVSSKQNAIAEMSVGHTCEGRALCSTHTHTLQACPCVL